MTDKEVADHVVAGNLTTQVTVILRAVAALLQGLDKVNPLENPEDISGISWILYDCAEKSKRAADIMAGRSLLEKK